MTQLAVLKASTSLHDVAHLLGYKASALAFILYKMSDAEKYKQFDIPKRSGGMRTIKAPCKQLKLLQRKLADLLAHCSDQINTENGRADQIAHGFKKGRSIFSNASPHRNKRWVFNIDLENFFQTIDFGRVRGFFMKDRSFLLNEKVATIIAQIACTENSLPQGGPSSPVISNMIGHLMDVHLVKLAKQHDCHYSRYADDLTFSSNKPIFSNNIATTDSAESGTWVPGTALKRIVGHARFSINAKKTRMQLKDSRQDVTGLIVNRKLNVKSEYRRTVRAMVHRLLTHGHFERPARIDNGTGVFVTSSKAGTTDELHGMLGFIDSVERYNRDILLSSGGKQKDESKKSPIEANKARGALTGKDQLYRRFLFYKEFFAPSKAVLVCEGETDNVYLVHAIRSLAGNYPMLATTTSPNDISIIPRIFKYVETSTGRILGLSGGSSDLASLIRNYSVEIKRFVRPEVQHPVILLIDNDDGALGSGGPLIAAKKVIGHDIDRNLPFTNLIGNLYLVPTPLLGTASQSMIENFFDAATLAVVIEGKSFNPTNKLDASKHYGKKIFAHKVIKPNASTINFNGFTILLDNITLAIEDFYKKYPPVTAP